MFTTANIDNKGTLQFLSNVSNGSNTCLPHAAYNYTIFAEWDNYRSAVTPYELRTLLPVL